MRVGQLLEELARRDVILVAADDRLEVDAPRGAITPTIRQELVKNKAALLAKLRARRATRPCFACRRTDYWERPSECGGGLVCSTCHPPPETCDIGSDRVLSEASPSAGGAGNRQTLARWALRNGCPELRFRPWESVVGTPTGWLAFLENASDEDVEAALGATVARDAA